jgi:propionate CoA-transferase
VNEVDQITFNGQYAQSRDQKVLYITERAVFERVDKGMLLRDIAPGIQLETDVLAQMDFQPLIAPDLQLMDSRIFE